MSEVDSLEVSIETTAKDTEKALDGLIKKLEIVAQGISAIKNNSGLEDFRKQVQELSKSFGAAGQGKKSSKTGKQISSSFRVIEEDFRKTVSEIRAQFEDLGKDFEFFGDAEKIQKKIESLSNKLEEAKLKQDSLIASGKTDGEQFENAVKNVVIYENQIESLKRKLESLKKTETEAANVKAVLAHDPNVFSGTITGRGHESSKSNKSIAEEVRSSMIPASSMQYNAEAMAQTFGESARNIREYAQAVEEYGARAGDVLNNPDLFNSDAIQETANGFEALGEKLSKLVVPEINTNSLENLQKELQKTENKAEEARVKLENGITMGAFSESPDNKTYVKMQTDIALAEKKAEALREKIEEIKKSSSSTKSGIFEKMKAIVSALLPMVSKLSGAINSKLSNSFKEVGKSAENFHNSISKNILSLLRYAIGARTVYMLAQKLKAAFVYGINNLVQYSNQTNSSVSLLVNSVNQLKNSVAAAASPLLNALAPALNTIIQLCINAANAINQLLSALTGHGTWIKAKKLTDNYASSLGGAAKAADNLRTHTLGIDELNVVEPDKGSGGGGGGGTSGADMFDTVEIESKYKKLADEIKKYWDMGDFTALGASVGQWVKNGLDSIDWRGIQESARKIASCIGTFINGFVETDGLGTTIGRTLGEAINTAVDFANTFLDVTHFDSIGKFLGDGLNGLVDTINWAEFGRLFASALNAVVETALNFGETINWVKIGTAIATAVNQFFATFDTAKLAKGINAWVNGIKKAITTAINKIKWKTVFKSLTDFASNLDLSSAFVVAIPIIGAFYKALKAIDIASFGEKWNGFKSTMGLVVQAFLGNASAAQSLSQSFPAVSNAVNLLGTAFQSLIYGIRIGDWAGGVRTAFSTITASLSTLSKALIGGGGILSDFLLVKSGFNDLALGSDNLVASIGKIAGGVAIAVAALKLIGLSNPFTALIVGATSLVAAIVGVNNAFNELDAERAGQTIADAFTKPGGTPFETIVQDVKDQLSSIGTEFDNVSTHINDFENSKVPIQNVLSEIDKIQTSMNAGVLGTEDGVAQLKAAYQDLVDAAKLRFQEYETLVFTTFSDGSEASKAFEAAGLDIEAYKERVTGFSSEAQQKIQALVDEISNYASTDPTNPRMTEAQSELAGLLGVTDELTKSMGDFDTYISGNPIDWSKYINGNALDVDSINSDLESLFTKAEETQQKSSDALQGIVNAAKDAGDEQNYEALKTALPGAIEAANQDAAGKVKEQTDLIQLQLLDVISNSISDAQQNWSEMSSIEKWLKWGNDEDAYIYNYVNSVKASTIDPMSSTIESGLEQLGIDGAGWASGAAEKMISALFDEVPLYAEKALPGTTETLKTDWQTILDDALKGATEAVDTEKYGKDTVEGFNNGITNNADSTKSSIEQWMDSIDTNIHDSALNFGSPSKKAEEYGQWVIEGFNNGIVNNTQSSVSAIETWVSAIASSVNESTWANMFAGIVGGFQTKWNEVTSWWQGTAMPNFFSSGVAPWFTAAKWTTATDGMKSGLVMKFDEFVAQWKTKINSWFESNVKPYFTVAKWTEQGEHIRNSLKSKWDEFQKQWQTDIAAWLKTDVEPNFAKEKWSGYGTQMKEGMYEGFKGIAEQVKTIINGLISAMNTAMSRITKSVNDLIEDYNDSIREMEEGDSTVRKISFHSIEAVSIPKYATGGFTEDGMFFANHNEMVGEFANGKTAVANNEQIVAGIASGVKSAVAEVLAPYLSQIADNTRETADKNMSISLDGRELVNGFNSRSKRNGFSFT